MSREITDTNSKYANKELPDGRNCFKVESIEKKYGQKGGEYFVWKLSHTSGEGEQILLPNMMGALLKALGCQEIEPGKYDWDTFEQYGKFFMATVSHKPDQKDPTKVRQHMSDFAKYEDAQIPF